ncbi:MAG TPA: RDD family protein, partial [Ilumatobacteraceae bacterium]|nr:RDD family protein [Ilumatobacteraceae bacterium]
PPPPGFGSSPPPLQAGTPPMVPPPPPYGAVATAPGYPPSYFQQTMVGGERAGFGTRLGAWLLDGLLYGLLSLVFVIPGTVVFFSAFSNCEWNEISENSSELLCPPGEPNGGAIAGGIVLILIGILFTAFLYVRAMGKTGQTWGAKIVGVKVIDERTGAPIGFGRALGRSLFANIFSSSIFYLGYLWMLWDDKKQTWQDKVVNSVVVKT